MNAAEPQAVLSPLTEAAIFLVLTVDPGRESAVRSLLEDASGLKRSVGFRIPEGADEVLSKAEGLGYEHRDIAGLYEVLGRMETVQTEAGA